MFPSLTLSCIITFINLNVLYCVYAFINTVIYLEVLLRQNCLKMYHVKRNTAFQYVYVVNKSILMGDVEKGAREWGIKKLAAAYSGVKMWSSEAIHKSFADLAEERSKQYLHIFPFRIRPSTRSSNRMQKPKGKKNDQRLKKKRLKGKRLFICSYD